jgi:Putative addiction module component
MQGVAPRLGNNFDEFREGLVYYYSLGGTVFTAVFCSHAEPQRKWRKYSWGFQQKRLLPKHCNLPGPLRALVAERLIESLDFEESEEITPEWREEIVRRCREIDEKIVELVPSETVLAKAYAALKR